MEIDVGSMVIVGRGGEEEKAVRTLEYEYTTEAGQVSVGCQCLVQRLCRPVVPTVLQQTDLMCDCQYCSCCLEAGME